MNIGLAVIWHIRVSNSRMRTRRERSKKRSTAIFLTIFRGFFSPLKFPLPRTNHRNPQSDPQNVHESRWGLIEKLSLTTFVSPCRARLGHIWERPINASTHRRIDAQSTRNDSRCNEQIASFSYIATTLPTVSPHQ